MRVRTVTIEKCANILKEQDNFLLVTHVRPDGDTLGCAAAMCRALQSLGKTAYMYINPEITEVYYDFVSAYFAPEGYEYDFAVAVDMASRGLDPVGFDKTVNLCIDHHDSNSFFAEQTLVLPEYAACGEIVLKVIKALDAEIDEITAQLLYIAISTDTGCFCFGSTTSNSLRSAAELIEAGADNGALNKYLFRTFSPARMKLEGHIFSSMKLFDEGRIAIAHITLDMMAETGAGEADCESIASLPEKISGVLIAVTIRQLRDDFCKLSVRTTQGILASSICEEFDGGGHPAAAGCTMLCGTQEAEELILAAALRELDGKRG